RVHAGISRLAPTRVRVHRAEHRTSLIVDERDAGHDRLLAPPHFEGDLDAHAPPHVDRIDRRAVLVDDADLAQPDPVVPGRGRIVSLPLPSRLRAELRAQIAGDDPFARAVFDDA